MLIQIAEENMPSHHYYKHKTINAISLSATSATAVFTNENNGKCQWLPPGIQYALISI